MKRPKVWLILILLLAFALRLTAIDRLPPGLSHDEAYNGIAALEVLEQGKRPIFFEINKGIEPLIIYLEALALYAFGVGPVPLRLVNVIAGMLTVALTYPLAARLFSSNNRQVALLAMAGVAVSFWAIFVSRLALRAVLLPPFLLLTLYFLWRGLADTSLIFLALSGLAAGVGMYTYLSARFFPLMIAAIFGDHLLRGRVRGRHWLGLLLLLGIWGALSAPLAGYYLEHRESFGLRAGQVSTLPYAFNGDFEPLARNTLLTLGMFTFMGDTTARYNLDGRPVFDWLNGLLFYGGVGVAVWGLRRSPQVALLLIGLFLMLLPDFITDDSPHFLRTIGALPLAYILWALGVERIGEAPHPNPLPRGEGKRMQYPIGAILILLMTVHTWYDYFGRWAEEARSIYGADVAEVADYVQASPETSLVAISAEYYRDLDRFRYALHWQGHPPFTLWFDGRQSLAFPPAESKLSPRYIFPASAPPAEAWRSFLRPVPSESGRAYSLYRLPEPAALEQAWQTTFPQENRLNVNVNDDLILAGYRVLGRAAPAGKFQLLLGWQALRTLPPGTDYTFLARLQDRGGDLVRRQDQGADLARQQDWAGADGNGYAPGDWQPGVRGLQLLTLRLPPDLPARSYDLTVAVVDRHTQQPLVTSAGSTVITLTSISVAGVAGREYLPFYLPTILKPPPPTGLAAWLPPAPDVAALVKRLRPGKRQGDLLPAAAIDQPLSIEEALQTDPRLRPKPNLDSSVYGVTTNFLAEEPRDGVSDLLPPNAAEPTPTPTPPPPTFSSSCAGPSGHSYHLVPVIGGDGRPASGHGDLNLALRGFSPTSASLSLVDYSGQFDPDALQLAGLFEPNRFPGISAVYRGHDWDWGCNCPGGPIGSPETTLIGLPTTPGEPIFVPERQAEIYGGGYKALVLYATETRITLGYTREDSVSNGYVVHIENVCIDPNLLGLYYSQVNAEGRHVTGRLPALRNNEMVGTALSGEIQVAVRDRGAFMDPRSRKDWWQGY